MAKLTNVYCTYTGGNIYVCTAKFGDVYLATDFDMYGTYDIPYNDIEEYGNYDYDGHWKTSADPLPTWQELFDAVRESYENGVSTNVDIGELETSLRYLHPDMNRRLDESDPEPEPMDENTERLTTISQFIEAFEEFLEERGIDIPNDEKDNDPDASTIYGSDYGDLSDRIEELLIRYGVLKGE